MPNVIMISIDTLRSDRLGCYGYTRPTSPNLDAFARANVVFKDVVAQSSSTAPSHAALFSSTYPFQHHRHFTEETALAGILRSHGYRTAAFVDGGQMRRVFGLDKGFELYVDGGNTDKYANVAKTRRGIRRIKEEAIEWLANTHEPFFLFIHCYDVHCPYNPPAPYLAMFNRGYSGDQILTDKCGIDINGKIPLTQEDVAHIQDLYDAGIRYTDEHVGGLLAYLEKKGLFSNSLIILLSDHGESLGERADHYVGHNQTYEYQLRVPLIIHFPSQVKRVIRDPVQLVDVMPTILAYLGVATHEVTRGLNLLPIIHGEQILPGPRFRLSQAEPAQSVMVVRADDRWKLVLDSQKGLQKLVDLKNDVTDERDYKESHPEVVADLGKRLSELISGTARVDYFQPKLDTETAKELRSLGYLH